MRGRRHFRVSGGDIVTVDGFEATKGAAPRDSRGTRPRTAIDELLDDFLSDCLNDPARSREKLLDIAAMGADETRWHSLADLRQEAIDRLSSPGTTVIVHRRRPRFQLPPIRPESQVAGTARRVEEQAPEPDIAITWIEAPCFIPGSEDIAIDYEISGPLSKVRSVRLAIASQASPHAILFEADIPDASGQARGTYRWTGSTTSPGGLATLQGSPYEARFMLTSASGRQHESNRAKVSVEVHGVEMEMAEPERAGVPQPHRKPLADLREELLVDRSPGQAHGRLIRTTPRFKGDSSEMYGDGSFVSYREKWQDDELLVPLILRIWLRGKHGDRGRAPKATEGTRVLWRVQLRDGAEFDDVMEIRPVHPGARRFIKAANAHSHADCRPAGWAAFREVGGLKARPNECSRGAPVERRLRGADWPHQEPQHRPWDLFTDCGDYSFTMEGDTGVWLRVGHVAGDACQVTALLDEKQILDVPDEGPLDEVPRTLRSNSISVENWRRVPVVRQLSVGRGRIAWEDVQRHFREAAMLVDTRPPSRVEDFTEGWSRYYRQAVAELIPTEPLLAQAVLDDPGPYPVRFRDFDDYWDRVDRGHSWLRHALSRLGEQNKYQRNCDDWATEICRRVARKMALPELVNGGITVVTFDTNRIHNLERGPRTVGLAPDIGASDRAAVLVFNAASAESTATAVHEIGHAMFLAHAPGSFDLDEPPAGIDPSAHDADATCLMSYDPRATSLCGFCLLKLAVWDPTKLNTDGTLNVS